MRRVLSASEAAALPDDVIVSVEGVSRALPPPVKSLPRWLVRVLPKSGLAGQSGETADDMLLDDEDQDEDDEDYVGGESAALHELSFQVRRGEGLGIVGEDGEAIATLYRIMIGGVPPTTGRVVVRGLVAPLSFRDLRRLIGSGGDKKTVKVIARYFHWPLGLIDSRWDEIVEFAALEELEQLPPSNRPKTRALRLAMSAALHMDATAYVLDKSLLTTDAEFGGRCLDVVAARKAEGAAVIQAGTKLIEGVARFADQVIWIEDGNALYRGLPVEVAAEVHRNTVEKVHMHSVPVTVKLVDGGPVRLGGSVSHVDFEVHVLRKDLELGFALTLTDESGEVVELSRPERMDAPEPGAYRLGVTVPPSLLDATSYRAKLNVEIAIVGHEPAAPRELLTFDVHVTPADTVIDDDIPVGFVLLPVADVELDESDTPTWDVSRISS
jgi:ABC-type polysaccharide/polyol phosphate transport system ATPase subunit